MRQRSFAVLTLTLAAGATLGACTGSSGGSGANNSSSAASAAGAQTVARAHGEGSVAGGTARAPSATAAHIAPDLILTGSLAVTVRSLSGAAGRAESIVSAAGGRTDADDRDAPRGSQPTATLTLRVPNTPGVMNRLAGLGHVRDRRLSTRDVTADVADVDSRVTSARTTIRSLRALYVRATKVSDVIRIETTLSQREAQLESFEARARSLGSQVALASVTLELTQKKAMAPPATKEAHFGGFVGGLEKGWHAFTVALSGLAVALGAVLPFLLVLLVIGAAVLLVRRRRAGPPTPASGD